MEVGGCFYTEKKEKGLMGFAFHRLSNLKKPRPTDSTLYTLYSLRLG